MMRDVYFFGCWDDMGHYLHAPGKKSAYKLLDTNPWGYKLDMGLCPQMLNANRNQSSLDRREVEGEAALHHKDSWTYLAWWDRSIDTRGACNAGLLTAGTYTFAEMIMFGKALFPKIMSRFKYEIKLVEVDGVKIA